MNRSDCFNFKYYKKSVLEILRIVASHHAAGSMDEQGVPAYLEGSYWSRWVFWHRLNLASQYITRTTGSACMDFGCGSGVLLPLLDLQFEKVYAVDIMPDLAFDFVRLWTDTAQRELTHIQFSSSLENAGIPANSLDLLLALDSLEHVDNLEETLVQMEQLLKPGGLLLISGPTENMFYRLGRRIVGFSGHYHHRSVYDIRKAVANLFLIRSVRKVRVPFTLFLLIEAEKR